MARTTRALSVSRRVAAATFARVCSSSSISRCTTPTSGVIAHNLSREPKELWTDQGAGDPIIRYHADDEVDEAQWITREMAHLHDAADVQVPDAGDRGRDAGRLRWGDIAVFYRTNAQTELCPALSDEAGRRRGAPPPRSG